MSVPISVLDLCPVTAATSGAAALHNSLDLAQLADRLGYTRYWLAEHHNLPAIASSAPEIMIGRIAAVTTRLRVGSGGVMLPNHAPLTVVERYKMLEALFPGRIDLGIGRAPGTDPVTHYALRRRLDDPAADDFLERFQELLLFASGGFPEHHPFSKVRAMPAEVPLPPVFLLGSSGYSAELAAAVGVGFSFAHHFSDYDPVAPMLGYRAQFKPSAWRAKPHAILAAHVICADTDAEADRLAATVDLNFVRRRKGEFVPLASPEEAARYAYTSLDRQRIAHNRERLVVGSVRTVMDRLQSLLAATRADELMITSMIYDHAARRRCYELLAEAFRLRPADASPQKPLASGAAVD